MPAALVMSTNCVAGGPAQPRIKSAAPPKRRADANLLISLQLAAGRPRAGNRLLQIVGGLARLLRRHTMRLYFAIGVRLTPGAAICVCQEEVDSRIIGLQLLGALQRRHCLGALLRIEQGASESDEGIGEHRI